MLHENPSWMLCPHWQVFTVFDPEQVVAGNPSPRQLGTMIASERAKKCWMMNASEVTGPLGGLYFNNEN